MPTYTVTAPKVGSANNYLSSIKIDNNNITGFNYQTYNYNVYLKSNINSVNISGTTIAPSARVTGIGTIKISSNNQTQKIIVTSESGKQRIYTINFIREEQKNEEQKANSNIQNNTPQIDNKVDSTKPTTDNNTKKQNESQEDTSSRPIADLMNHSGFKYNDNYLFGINVGTNVSNLIANIFDYNKYVTISITAANGQPKSNDIFKTGDKITIKGSDGTRTFNAIIYGDVNGDGKISAVDYVKVKNQILKGNTIDGIYLKSADVNKDNKITAVDYVKIKNQILGKSSITQ